MKLAAPNASKAAPDLVAILRVPRSQLSSVVPVPLQPLEPFTEPEPSTGATVRLKSGRHVVVIYGLETERLHIYAEPAEGASALADFLTESGLEDDATEWIRPAQSWQVIST